MKNIHYLYDCLSVGSNLIKCCFSIGFYSILISKSLGITKLPLRLLIFPIFPNYAVLEFFCLEFKLFE